MVAPPDNDVLQARGLYHAHGGTTALTDVSLDVREGEILAVTGPRGCGKTTLLSCLAGHLAPERGELWFHGAPVHTLSPRGRERLRLDHFGWIDTEPQLVAELTAWENAALPLLLRGVGHREARRTAEEWLDRLDVSPCARRRPAKLDQSQRQRVAIARALATDPQVVFADEPTAPLHRADGAQVLRTLTNAARSHRFTVVLATHEPEAAVLADRTVALLDGRRVASAPDAKSAGEKAGEPAGAAASQTAAETTAETTGETAAESAGEASSAGSTPPEEESRAACSLSV